MIVKAFFIARVGGQRKATFEKRFHNHKKLMEIRHYENDTILSDCTTNKFKKQPVLKWFIVERVPRYSKITEKKCALHFHGKFEIRIIKQATPTYLELIPNCTGK